MALAIHSNLISNIGYPIISTRLHSLRTEKQWHRQPSLLHGCLLVKRYHALAHIPLCSHCSQGQEAHQVRPFEDRRGGLSSTLRQVPTFYPTLTGSPRDLTSHPPSHPSSSLRSHEARREAHQRIFAVPAQWCAHSPSLFALERWY